MRTERVMLEVNEQVLAGDDAFALIEPVWWLANIHGSLDDYESSLQQFSYPQRLLFALHWYLAEVDNGGHDQFYFNCTGIVWPDALEAFKQIGVLEGAEIIERSANLLGGIPGRERDRRQEELEEHAPDFEDLDEELYQLQARINLDAKMLQFARNRLDEFRFKGFVERSVLDGIGEEG